MAARIIEDLEVGCVNKMCEWKDRLENLEKHTKHCQLEKQVPDWVKSLNNENLIAVEDDDENREKIYGTDVSTCWFILVTLFALQNDALYEKLNEEMPRSNLSLRLLEMNFKNLKTSRSRALVI